MGNFWVGESVPLKGCWFKVAHIEQGVVVLALNGFTNAGIEAVARLKAEFQRQEMEEVAKDGLLLEEKGDIV